MNEEDIIFLQEARVRVKNNPDLFGHLITTCTAGINEAIRVERERAADFESIAAAYMAISGESRKTPTTTVWANNLIKKKMIKWGGKTSLNFDDEISKLEGN